LSQLLQVATRTGVIPAVDGTAAPEYVDQGVPYDGGGLLAIDTVTPASYYHQGLPFTPNGRVHATVNNPTHFNSGGMPLVGNILSVQPLAVDHTNGGIPYTVNSGIART